MIRRLHIFVLLFFSIIGYSQQITGIVIEAGSELPIPGATILLKEKSMEQTLILMENLLSIMFQMVT